jgi:hypothetical protein
MSESKQSWSFNLVRTNPHKENLSPWQIKLGISEKARWRWSDFRRLDLTLVGGFLDAANAVLNASQWVPSVNDKDGRAVFGKRSVRRSIVICDVVTRAHSKRILPTVLMLDSNVARDHEDNMALGAPMLSDIASAVINETKLNVANLTCAGSRRPRCAGMHRRWYLWPIDDPNG